VSPRAGCACGNCARCVKRAYDRARYEGEVGQKKRAQARAWTAGNREKKAETGKKWREATQYDQAYSKSENGMARTEKYRQANKDMLLAKLRKYRTGWGPDEFKAAWDKQQGLCAICGEPMRLEGPPGKNKAVADHFERDGVKISRAILHSSCNQLLGVFEHGKARFQPYLDKYGASF
jgi:hypothetical protein